jgi:hypothetical protein
MRGRRAKQLDASISKAAKQVKAAETARLMKPKAQIKSERAAKAEAKRQVAAAKPKRVRSAESLRVSRAKRITKERSISLNPAGNTQKGAGRMAANAKRTQDRALAFYKGKAKPKDGTDITREIGRAKANKRIKNLNQQIKEAGTNAAGLRLEKLKVQTRMPNKPRQRLQPTAKQSAKEASRNDAIRKRSAELRAQSGRLQRNQANIQRLKNQSPKPGSRRLSSSQVRRQNRADTAKDIYSAPSAKRRAQIVGNQRGLARTERAKNNSMRLRSDRLAEAKATGLSMIKVTRPAKPAAAKPAAAKPAAAKRSGAVGKISEAKAGRIVARMDAQRGRKALPGRRNANFVRTYERSRQFILKPSTAALKKGKPISVNESVQKAVANAAKRRKAKPAAAKPAAAKTKLKRSGKKIGVGRLTTNEEQGRKGIVSMSSQAKAARKGAVAERKSAKMSRIAERQSEIVARRQGRRASNYNPDGTFNQSTFNANQRRLGRSKQLQEKLRYAGGGKNIASKALSKRRKPK